VSSPATAEAIALDHQFGGALNDVGVPYMIPVEVDGDGHLLYLYPQAL
jgi:hypothetical protein